MWAAIRGRQGGHLSPRFDAQPPISCKGFFSSHIIAILAAILFPVFAKAREKARQSSCLSNLKQIGTGFLMYAQDYDERLFGARLPREGWTGALMPYVKNTQLFGCPSFTGNLASIARGSACGGCGNWVSVLRGGYTYSNTVASSTGSYCAGATTAIPLAGFDKPAERILCYDGDPTGGGCVHGTPTATPSSSNMTNLHITARHNEGYNATFYDGHTKWQKELNPAFFKQ